MAGRGVSVKAVKKVGWLCDEWTEIKRQLAKRAFELFEDRGWLVGHDIDNWLQAERELLWRPCAEVTETGEAIRATFALAGLVPKHVEVMADPVGCLAPYGGGDMLEKRLEKGVS